MSETCPCFTGIYVDPLDVEHHDWLLECAERGFAGAVDLLTHFEVTMESAPRPGDLQWNEFATFTAMHNWPEPYEVWRLVQHVEYMAKLAGKAAR
jgi:hypothetical protein